MITKDFPNNSYILHQKLPLKKNIGVYVYYKTLASEIFHNRDFHFTK